MVKQTNAGLAGQRDIIRGRGRQFFRHFKCGFYTFAPPVCSARTAAENRYTVRRTGGVVIIDAIKFSAPYVHQNYYW
jgi:hypothetical protein